MLRPRFSRRHLVLLLLLVAAGLLAGAAEAGARPFADIIDAAARRHGVDADLVHAVIAVESGYRASAQSPAGAQGLMQLMPGTQRELGVSDAFDPRQNVDAGVAYLRRLTDQFGTVLALAAYNAGPGAVRRYNGIPPYAETRAYVRAVLDSGRPAGDARSAEDQDPSGDRAPAVSGADLAAGVPVDRRLRSDHPVVEAVAELDSEAPDEKASPEHPAADPVRRVLHRGADRLAVDADPGPARRDMMSAGKLAAAGLATMIATGCGAPDPAPEPEPAVGAAPEPPQFAVTGEHPCDPVGDVRFLCDMVSPEDVAVIPGAEWAIVSGAREGGRLNLVNVADKTSTVVFPTPDSEQRLDAAAYPACPGPFDLANPDVSRLHGLYLDPGEGDVHTLLVVHHGPREAIEFFEVDAGDAVPSLTWTGCAVAPEGANLNSVVALPDGGFAATNAGIGVWEWQAGSGWEVLPESEDTAPNGIEVSADGRTLYIAGWAEEKLTRLSRGVTPVQKDVVELGFRPDNLRMALDGSVIYAAGHTDRDGNSITDPREPTLETSNVAAIDPDTLEFERVFVHPAMNGFVSSTTAIRIGDELWLGSYRGDRLAWLPMPE